MGVSNTGTHVSIACGQTTILDPSARDDLIYYNSCPMCVCVCDCMFCACSDP